MTLFRGGVICVTVDLLLRADRRSDRLELGKRQLPNSRKRQYGGEAAVKGDAAEERLRPIRVTSQHHIRQNIAAIISVYIVSTVI